MQIWNLQQFSKTWKSKNNNKEALRIACRPNFVLKNNKRTSSFIRNTSVGPTWLVSEKQLVISYFNVSKCIMPTSKTILQFRINVGVCSLIFGLFSRSLSKGIATLIIFFKSPFLKLSSQKILSILRETFIIFLTNIPGAISIARK